MKFLPGEKLIRATIVAKSKGRSLVSNYIELKKNAGELDDLDGYFEDWQLQVQGFGAKMLPEMPFLRGYSLALNYVAAALWCVEIEQEIRARKSKLEEVTMGASQEKQITQLKASNVLGIVYCTFGAILKD
ncbi:hypothetical protein WICPIJ_001903 [Wickerhamomyces pijperi]|uniref:Uncharacterized protein n=1 Tax=Wickerhamomyces pijperi TaxID=599730 RepID=A0A9P8Q9Z3_WICPI|nr:hypothetical protein WICPIJ_001903 [Wickerhamomyces pijperi]